MPELSSFVEMPVSNVTFDACPDSSDLSQQKGFRFAHPFDVHFSPSNCGQWVESDDGDVWRLGIVSNEAHSVYLSCQSLGDTGDARIFVYSNHYQYLQGSFLLSKFPSYFSLPAVPGDTLMVEINVADHLLLDDGFAITRVWHDFANVLGNQNRGILKLADNPCDENIQCENGLYWQTQKRAVCKIVSDGQLSTGTLVGNVAGTRVPYVLTAHHTIFDSVHAAQALFYFNHETSGCDSYYMPEPQVLMGSALVATSHDGLDFSLLRLHEVPPPSFRPFYAGWSRSCHLPDGGICLHHPFGDVKQIAIEYHPPAIGTYNANFQTNAFWHIPHWEVGTTSPGSSGAPLFDPGHRLIGTLTGGRASCSYPMDDYFCRFDLAWNSGATSDARLADWLDPQGTNADAIAGYDPYGVDSDLCDTVWNVAPDLLRMKPLVLPANGVLPLKMAEKFYLNGALNISSVYLVVRQFDTSDRVTLKVWEGDDMPLREVFSQSLVLHQLQRNAINEVRLDSIVSVSGNFFVGIELDAALRGDPLLLSYWRESSLASSTMLVFDDQARWHQVDDEFGGNASLGIGLSACNGSVKTVPPAVFTVYPNPCSNVLMLALPDGTMVSSLNCYGLSGRLMNADLIYNESGKSVAFNLPRGTYILKLCTQHGVLHTKFTVSGH
ncbi:MAG: hypothetical protein JXR39_07395 [Marinilabiliaceae bacterium]|nr:hypothetical protein [Marinilabiliaceae bacterium]